LFIDLGPVGFESCI